MKIENTKTFQVTIKSDYKSKFGTDFMENVLRSICESMDLSKKGYHVIIKNIDDPEEKTPHSALKDVMHDTH